MNKPTPIILVSDYTTSVPTTTLYISPKVELNFLSTYQLTYQLLTFPPCTHQTTPTPWPCLICDASFGKVLWPAAASLTDYFATFFPLDTALMQSLWFHMLDLWQDATASFLPFESVLKEAMPPMGWSRPRLTIEAITAFTHFQILTHTLSVMQAGLWGVKRAGRIAHGTSKARECVMHDPRGIRRAAGVGGEDDKYSTGPWISGLRGWQQFLCEGSPGFAHYIAPATRILPQSVLAMFLRHCQRTRGLAERLYKKMYPGQVGQVQERMRKFDEKGLKFPRKSFQGHRMVSPVDGRVIQYMLLNGAIPIIRPQNGWQDPEFESEDPPLHLLDEALAMSRGFRPYVAYAARGRDATVTPGVTDDLFDVWALQEVGVLGQPAVCGAMEGWDDMFDEWVDESE